METSTYINRAFDDHLNNPINYKEIIEEDAHLINKTNFCWICERFIDYRNPDTVTDKKIVLPTLSLRSDSGQFNNGYADTTFPPLFLPPP